MRSLYLFFIAIVSVYNFNAQSNSYFQNNESWSGQDWITDNYKSFYSILEGDTIINNDTLVKIKVPTDIDGMDTLYFLAKDDTGVLFIFRSNQNYSSINDTVINDYSRTDSITSWSSSSQTSAYTSRKILSIDSVLIGNIYKKRFFFDDECDNNEMDFVIEGLFNINRTPYFNFCFEFIRALTCISVNDSNYWYHEFDSVLYNQGVGPCIIYNLSIDEINSKFSIFPIPAQNYLTIKSEYNIPNQKGCILTLEGKKIKSFAISNSSTQIDISELSNGIYIVCIENKQFKTNYKIIINK